MAEMLQKDEIVVRDIIDTARTLFKKTGFKKTTMGDIARSLGKAKSSLYYYYPSKEDIFEAVLYSEMDELLDDYYEDEDDEDRFEEVQTDGSQQSQTDLPS